jgi:hypothetical protein
MWKLVHGLVTLRLCGPCHDNEATWDRSSIHRSWKQRANLVTAQSYVCYYLRQWHYTGPGFNQISSNITSSAPTAAPRARPRPPTPFEAINSRYIHVPLCPSHY